MMKKLILVHPSEMLNEDNRLTVTSDINQAMIEYGFMIKANYLKCLFYENGKSPGHINDFILSIAYNYSSGQMIPVELYDKISQKTSQYLYNLPTRRRVALSFIILNSEEYQDSLYEINNNSNYSELEKKRITGREIEREIYVTGSYELEKMIHKYLISELFSFVKEYSRTIKNLSNDKVLKIIEVYSNSCIAKLSCEMVD